MAQQPQGKHMEVKHMGDSDKKRRATILKGVFVVLLLVAVGCGGIRIKCRPIRSIRVRLGREGEGQRDRRRCQRGKREDGCPSG